jgi:transposase InsO family protein
LGGAGRAWRSGGRQRVWRLMRAAGLRGCHPRAFKRTTVAGQRRIEAPDLIGQDFTAEAPDTRWCGDITYTQTVDGWVYTATVIDLHSRKVFGYAVADHLRTSLIVEGLAAALGRRVSKNSTHALLVEITSLATSVAVEDHASRVDSGEHECGLGELADPAGADGDALECSPAAG